MGRRICGFERWGRGKQAPIGIGFDEAMKDLIEKLAEQEQRSFATQVRQLLLEGLEARKANGKKV